MSSIDPDTHLELSYIQDFFSALRKIPDNMTCFQCNAKNPSWASVNLGVFLCYNCTSHHRNLGTHISFVRSTELDKWSLRQLAKMGHGGNKKARDFFRAHGCLNSIDYSSSICERYRSELDQLVNTIYPRKSAASPTLPPPVQDPPKLEPPQTLLTEELKEELKKDKLNSAKEPVKPIRPAPAVPRANFQVNSGASHKFKTSKQSEPSTGVKFKPVRFR